MLDRLQAHGNVEHKHIVSERAEMSNSSSVSEDEIFNTYYNPCNWSIQPNNTTPINILS